MLTDSLTSRLEELADQQPFVPSMGPILHRAQAARRRRRVAVAAGGGLSLAALAVGVAGVLATVDHPDTSSTGLGDSPPSVALHAVTVTTPFSDTCVDMTFTQTGQTVRVGCRQASWAFPAQEHVTPPGVAHIAIRPGDKPTWIAYGEVATESATITARLNTGHSYRAAIIHPPAGYPYYPVYIIDLGPDANIGAGANWIKSLTVTDKHSDSTLHIPPMATPAPTS